MKPDDPLPLQPPNDRPPVGRTPAPAWVALLAPWTGLLALVLAIAIPFVPGSRDPQGELTHAVDYTLADRILTIAIYLCSIAIFLGAIVLRQMAREPRPLEDYLVMHRAQAWTGIVLGLVAAGLIYGVVALWGPRAAL